MPRKIPFGIYKTNGIRATPCLSAASVEPLYARHQHGILPSTASIWMACLSRDLGICSEVQVVGAKRASPCSEAGDISTSCFDMYR